MGWDGMETRGACCAACLDPRRIHSLLILHFSFLSSRSSRLSLLLAASGSCFRFGGRCAWSVAARGLLTGSKGAGLGRRPGPGDMSGSRPRAATPATHPPNPEPDDGQPTQRQRQTKAPAAARPHPIPLPQIEEESKENGRPGRPSSSSCFVYFALAAISASAARVTGSLTSAPPPCSAGSNWLASCLPSSTPNWSNALMPHITDCT